MKFQFLLVRLKVLFALSFRQEIFISIPSGAIKSSGANSAHILTPKFQFLLVRLKVFSIDDSKIIKHHFNSFWCD